MRRTLLGRLVARYYRLLPASRHWLRLAVRLEGGEMYSLSLRDVLITNFQVELGHFSYGSFAQPGMADRHTKIGRYVSVGPGVRRIGAAHPMQKPSLHPFWYNSAFGFVSVDEDVARSACAIEADAWIGANAIILPGCARIGVGAVVGAGSIVTKDVPDFAIVVGSPARQVGTRLTAKQREFLGADHLWALDPWDLQATLERVEGLARET